MRTVIDKYAGKRFDYRSDCCRFVAECLEALTGSNPIAGLEYRTKSQAKAVISKYGSLRAAVTHYLGNPLALPLPPEGILEGDVCLIDTNDGQEALAIVYRGRIIARVASGLMDYPLSRALDVWRIPPCRQ